VVIRGGSGRITEKLLRSNTQIASRWPSVIMASSVVRSGSGIGGSARRGRQRCLAWLSACAGSCVSLTWLTCTAVVEGAAED
jgi:hypothetical protein